MRHFDVFNGDADGICALHQLRLARPLAASLITGVKRDVALLARVTAQQGDAVSVLDISLDVNRHALDELLARGVYVEYFDHHFAGAIPRHSHLKACIDTSPDVCTSMLVDHHLQGKHRLWAIVAAFGDNMLDPARRLAAVCGLRSDQTERLSELGESINYNAYGDSEADILVPPARLYEALHPYADPFEYLDADPMPQRLSEQRCKDLEMALRLPAEVTLGCGSIFLLPNEPWARRVRGAFSNHLAMCSPGLAHAVLTETAQGDYTVSLRAPTACPDGADRVCRQFESGGGRKAAAGINSLPRDRLAKFVRAFEEGFR